MEQHRINSLKVGEFLSGHPAVKSIRHPGLPSHPQHELAKKQVLFKHFFMEHSVHYRILLSKMSGHSGMISFYLNGGLAESEKLLSSLKVITLAESLGGFESLAELPYSMTHASVEEKERVSLGVTDNLIRLSVGLEDVDDLIADLKQALETAVKAA